MNSLSGHFLTSPTVDLDRSDDVAATGGASLTVRSLELKGPRLRFALAVDTLSAAMFREGPITLLTLGLRNPEIGMRSRPEALELASGLSADPSRALSALRGGWMLLFADERCNRCILATDRAATRAPCFAIVEGLVAFGLAATDVAQSHREFQKLDTQAIFDYLRSHFIPTPATVFHGIQRLGPGEFVEITNGNFSRSRYWEPQYDEVSKVFNFESNKVTFRTLLEASVRAEVSQSKTGAFLSGGTDSSTIAGMLGHVTGQRAETYSIGFDAPGYDEMDYARIASRHFGTRHHEYYITPDDLVTSIPKVAAAYDQPFGNSSALPAYYCAKMAHADGVSKMLGGDGGDEIFGGNSRYAKQKIFHGFHQSPAWIRSAIAPLLMRSGKLSSVAVIRKARSFIEQAQVPMPARLHTYNLLDRIGIAEIFAPAFANSIDRMDSANHETQFYAKCSARSLVNNMLHLDWKYTLADNDLPKVVGTCDLAGIAVAFPMLNEELVQFANALPPSQKVKGLKLRYFFKAALRDFLPPEIIAKQKHGFGMPFGLWLMKHPGLWKLSADSLESLRMRNIVRAEFIDSLLKRRLHEHASYYGELVWVMMMLEQWLQAHRPTFVHTA